MLNYISDVYFELPGGLTASSLTNRIVLTSQPSGLAGLIVSKVVLVWECGNSQKCLVHPSDYLFEWNSWGQPQWEQRIYKLWQPLRVQGGLLFLMVHSGNVYTSFSWHFQKSKCLCVSLTGVDYQTQSLVEQRFLASFLASCTPLATLSAERENTCKVYQACSHSA